MSPIRPARELKSDAGDGERCVGELADEIATELNLLSQSHRTPEAFLERRDFLVKRLRRLAKRLKAQAPPPPRRSASAPSGAQEHGHRVEVHFAPRRAIGGAQRETLRITRDRA